MWIYLTPINFYTYVSFNDTKSVITNREESNKKKKLYEISTVVQSYADVVTLIEGIFVAQSMGSKKISVWLMNSYVDSTRRFSFVSKTKFSSQRI